MLSAPASSSSLKISARIAGETSFPRVARDTSKFWQKRHFNGQPQKKMQPLPFLNDMGGSSNGCR